MAKMSTVRALGLAAAIAVTGILPSPVLAEPVSTPGITSPSKKSKLSFMAGGIVSKVDVKEGDLVKEGQILAHQDDRMEAKLLESMKLEGESVLKVDYAKADLELKKVQLKRKEQMLTDNVASASEVEEARLAVTLAETQVALAELEHKQKFLDYKRGEIKVDLMHLPAPFAGRIEKIDISQGEATDPSKPALLIVQTDPLWVELHLPSSQARALKPDQPLDVRYDASDKWTPAKIIFFAGVDPASDTQLVRLELPNPSNRPPGLQVQVNLPENVAQAGGVNR